MDLSILNSGGLDHSRWLSAGQQVDKARASAQASAHTSTQASDKGGAAKGGPAEAAQAFESMLLRQLMQTMRRTSLGEDTSNAMRTYYDMMDEKLADVMAERGSIGIAQAIEQQIRAQQGDAAPGDESSHGAADAPADSAGAHASPPGFVEQLWAGRAYRQTDQQVDPLVQQPAHQTARAEGVGSGLTNSEHAGFVESLWPHAQRAARRLGAQPAAIVAVAALETGFGVHVMGDGQGGSSHNLFGIKHHGSQHASVTHRTTEFFDGQPRAVQADFRRYASVAQSVDDFASFLLDNPRYASALEQASDPQRFVDELQRAGYATDPGYAGKLRQLMQRIDAYMSRHMGPDLSSPS